MAVTRTPKVANPSAVKVSPSTGQFLHFILEADGPIPIFAFASSAKGVLFEAQDFPGHPKTNYEWDHLKNPSDIQQLEELQLRLSFFTSADYTYITELRDAVGTVSKVLEISYSGTSTDIQPESFTVVII